MSTFPVTRLRRFRRTAALRSLDPKAGLKALVEQFAEKPKGNPVLAADTDKRPALPAHFEVFDVGDILD